MEEYNQAISVYEKANPEYYEAYNNLAIAIKDQGKFDDVLSRSSQLIKEYLKHSSSIICWAISL